jgi:uncharacterized protein (DUF488 family)
LPRIRTAGHSTRPLAVLIAMLHEAGITLLADVRALPRSRRHPQFDRQSLAEALPAAGIAYQHFAALGGLRSPRPDSDQLGWREPAFRGYADYMQTEAFARAIDELIARVATDATAILCAEADPANCHRGLIADALMARGLEVEHLLEPGRSRLHVRTPFARFDGPRVTYPGPAALPGLFGPRAR